MRQPPFRWPEKGPFLASLATEVPRAPPSVRPSARSIAGPRLVRYPPSGTNRGAAPSQAVYTVVDGEELPRLIKTIKLVDLLKYNGKVYAVPQRLGSIEVDEDWRNRHPAIKVYHSIVEATQAVEVGLVV